MQKHAYHIGYSSGVADKLSKHKTDKTKWKKKIAKLPQCDAKINSDYHI